MPAAPPTFSNWKLPTRPASRAAFSIERAVPSQPPPGAAGTNIRTFSNKGAAWAKNGKPATVLKANEPPALMTWRRLMDWQWSLLELNERISFSAILEALE